MIDQVQEEIIAEFSMFDDWLDKYNYLIELGNALPPIDPAHRTEQYAITGCQSRVWLDARLEKDAATGKSRVWFSADSDAIITKGIISLLIRVLNGHTPREILDTDLYFIDRVGLRENLSPTRANGLAAMVKQMKMYALAFDTQDTQDAQGAQGATNAQEAKQ